MTRDQEIDCADTYEFVCTNSQCDYYNKQVEVPVVFGTSDPIDSRDLDCECGAVLIPVEIAQAANSVEWVDPDIQRRYLDVQAVKA